MRIVACRPSSTEQGSCLCFRTAPPAPNSRIGGHLFNITEIKNAHRHRVSEKKPAIPLDELFEAYPEENKPMPYFSIVPEQAQRDRRYQALSKEHQGDFWRLCLRIAGPGERGRFVDHGPLMAKRMRMAAEEWEPFRAALLIDGLLSLSPDSIYLIQPELREQCLQYARSKERG